MAETSPRGSIALKTLQNEYGRRITRADDLELGSRVLVAAGIALSVAELGILAFSESRGKKVAGALAPVIAFAAAMEVDQACLNAQQDAQFTARAASYASDILGQPVPEWAEAAIQ